MVLKKEGSSMVGNMSRVVVIARIIEQCGNNTCRAGDVAEKRGNWHGGQCVKSCGVVTDVEQLGYYTCSAGDGVEERGKWHGDGCVIYSPPCCLAGLHQSGENDWSPVIVRSLSGHCLIIVWSLSNHCQVIVQSFSGHSLCKSENDQNSLSSQTPVDFDWTMTRQ